MTNFTIYSILQYHKTHFSNIPTFHHSNWGEAPNLKRLVAGLWLLAAGVRNSEVAD